MKELIEAYLNTKKFAWEDTTLKSERARLQAHADKIPQGPEAHYLAIKDSLGAFSIKKIFQRCAAFETFTYKTTRYQEFMDTNRRLFKHVYEKEKIEIGFEEARIKILAIKDPEVRAKALDLLTTGMRWSESFTIDGQGTVVGKGGKRRRVYNSKAARFIRSYSTFLRKLYRATGLKPHTLRKIYVTHLLRQGIPIHEVKDIVGHKSIETTAIYAQSRKEEELSDTLRKMVG